MSTKRLLSTNHFHPFPPMMKNYLQWAQNTPTHKSGMRDACVVFHDIKEKNVVSWTTLIAGYTHRGNGNRALQIFREMLLDGVALNPHSISIAVRACASIGSQNFGRQIHTAVIKHGFESDLPVTNSILDMYCRCGCLSEANKCFNGITEKDLITWNTLIAGYERSDSIEPLFIFSQMESEGFTPNCFTFTSLIATCANLAALCCGQQIHGGIFRRGLDRNLELANALIDMYAKCGNIFDSHKIFSEMSCRNLVSWTSMMIGYGAHGYGKKVVELFDEMVSSSVELERIKWPIPVADIKQHSLKVNSQTKQRKLPHMLNIQHRDDVILFVIHLHQPFFNHAAIAVKRAGNW
ncbi:hypothetical protein OIU74_026295 [Salix koriyanagi]|uniref:Pentatricopeptide repeat-containing protein n=1 Tax=Salix koriyanagi TaxID=2511006 RepID=A0A9Q1A3J8_9ROSI|nr:hypothetical protein OIU74_026295 [Salix koriyanagi]